MKIYNITVKFELINTYNVWAESYDEALAIAETQGQDDAKIIQLELGFETNNIEAINAP